MAAVAAELRVRHRFTTAYAPWANGTVEVVCRQVLKALRQLCPEFKLSFQEWPEVLYVVQSVLNSASSSKLRGNCPFTVFASMPAGNPITMVLPKEQVESTSLELLKAEQSVNVADLQSAVAEMHKAVSTQADRLREKSIRPRNHRTNVMPVNYSIGDIVLGGTVRRSKLPKLFVTWLGPYRAVRFEHKQVLEVEHLLSGKRKKVHITRVKFYRDASLEVTEELVSFLEYQDSILFCCRRTDCPAATWRGCSSTSQVVLFRRLGAHLETGEYHFGGRSRDAGELC
jgi:hypothetical protein